MKGVTIAAAWLVLAALSSASAESGPARVVAGTDLGRHTVPLEQVLFDTFDGGMLPLSQATEAQVLRLRDAIRPVRSPRYDSVQEAGRWLAPEDLLVAYVAGGAALAYPVRILNFHEIVNETVDGVPILISYCPLCGSGIVYDRRLDGRELVFGNTSALYESDMVMYDRQTLSYWFQVSGEAIVGELAGRRLTPLPSLLIRFDRWRRDFPEGRVLSPEGLRGEGPDPFAGYTDYLNAGRFAFPVSDAARDPALPAGERIVGVVVDGTARAYPVERLRGRVVNDALRGTPLAVAVDALGNGFVFDRRSAGTEVRLAWDEAGALTAADGRRWSAATGAALGTGEPLAALPSRWTYWFSFASAFPEASVYTEG
ncbi:MAG: DUF3179 domain-containing protein [Spirochaetaceae bacterium]|nr:DUF3179 domain-containing protein [Spirochaetaceae bacterium]